MSSNVTKPWWQVYSGNKEARFFRVLARDKNHTWRSMTGLAKDAGITVVDAETIAEKYVLSGQVVQQTKDPSMFAYFENVPKKSEKGTIADENKVKRVKDAQASNP